MQTKQVTFVPTFHARYTINNVNCNLKAESLSELQATIARQLHPGEVRLDNSRSQSTHSIYSDEQWIGYITKTEVPDFMTVRSETETRKAQERAA